MLTVMPAVTYVTWKMQVTSSFRKKEKKKNNKLIHDIAYLELLYLKMQCAVMHVLYVCLLIVCIFPLFTFFFFTCRKSMHGRYHVLPRLSEFRGVVLNCFRLSRQTGWTEVLLSWTGRHAQTTVQGNCLFKDMGQEQFEYVRYYLTYIADWT